jgi:hypothetical protein
MVTLAAQFYLRDKPFQYLTVLSDIGAALVLAPCLFVLFVIFIFIVINAICAVLLLRRAFEAAHQELC